MQEPDIYYVPPHLSAPFSVEEVAAFKAVFFEADKRDGDADGFIDVDLLDELLLALDEKPTESKRKEVLEQCDPKDSGDLPFLDLLRCVGKLRFKRNPFAGKRCISDEIPLPLPVETPYDEPCMQHPDRRAQMEDPTNPTVAALRAVFNRHDADKSGEIEMDEVVGILRENHIPFDTEQLEVVFQKFDVDGSNTLDFVEFCEMMADLKAETAIVEQRSVSYELPQNLRGKFSSEQVAEYKVHFGMFDADGGGSIAAEELAQVLADLGMEPTQKQVESIIRQVDRDRSGEIEFGEFVGLMHKINTGQIEVGESVLAQAVMNSSSARRLRSEVDDLQHDPLPGVEVEVQRQHCEVCDATIQGPVGTPYEGGVFVLRIAVGDDYPFAPPTVEFTTRVMHLNMSILLNGRTALPQLLQDWDAEWTVRSLLQYVWHVLHEPDPELLPEHTRHAAVQEHHHGAAHADAAFDHLTPPGFDLREKPTAARVHAGMLGLFYYERAKYDDICRQFTRNFSWPRPEDR